MSRKDLADLYGCSVETVRLWETEKEKGGTAPTRERLPLVASQLKTSGEWLSFGIDANLESHGNYLFIPRYKQAQDKATNVNFHDEIGGHAETHEHYAYRKDYLAQRGLNPQQCRVVLSTDDSMELGTQQLVDMSDTTIKQGKAYLVGTAVGPRVRRLYPRFDGVIVMRADNPDFPEEHAPADAVKVLGRVVAFQGDC